MNEKNNVNLEGVIIECSLDTSSSKNIQYASMIVCTSTKKRDGSNENAYHKVRFPVSSENTKKIAQISSDCLANKAKLSDDNADKLTELITNYISVNGELRHDSKSQPFILAEEKDIDYPEKAVKSNNRITLEGQLEKIEKVNSVAATVMIKVPSNKSKSKTTVPVFIDAKKNPLEWAAITTGKVSEGDIFKVSGKLDVRLYGSGPKNRMLMLVSVKPESVSIENNLKRQNKPGRKR